MKRLTGRFLRIGVFSIAVVAILPLMPAGEVAAPPISGQSITQVPESARPLEIRPADSVVFSAETATTLDKLRFLFAR